MSTFADDFNRPDGGLANNWAVRSGSAAIVSNAASLSTSTVIQQTSISATGRQEAIWQVGVSVLADTQGAAALKMNASWTQYFTVLLTGSLASPTWTLRYRNGAGGTNLAAFGGPAISTATHTLRLLWADSVLYFWFDGYFIGSGATTTLATESLMGFASVQAVPVLDSITLYGDVTTSFTVSPSPIGNYGSPTELTFTGVGTSWTAGTPGSPTFTVSNGSLSNQVVASATSATATYDPQSFLGIATFTDPSTGATCDVTVTSNPNTLPVSEICPFDEDFVTTANATVLAADRGLPTLQSIIVPAAHNYSDVYLLEAIADLWYSHFRPEDLEHQPTGTIDRIEQLWLGLNSGLIFDGSTYIPDHAGGVKEDTDKLLTAMEALTATYTDLATVVGLLGGSPTVYSHADLKTAIDLISTGSNQDVLDALAAYFGENPPTIEQLGTMVSDIATIAGYDLGDVLDAIAAIPTNTITSLQPVLDRLDDIQPSGADTLTTIQAAIVPSSAIQAIVDAGTLALAGEEGATIAAVLDAIAALQPASGGGAPVWPGLDGVTFGTPVNMVDQLHLETTMDGVIIAVTTPPERVGRYNIGGATMDYGAGRIAFETDNGDLEAWQYLGFRAAIYTPKTMAHAAGVRLQVLGGAAGTVTPWTVSQ